MPHSPSLSSVGSHHHTSHRSGHHRDPRLDSYHNPDSLHQSGALPPPGSRSDARRWNKKVFAPDAHAHIHTYAPHHLGHAAAYQAYRHWKRNHDPDMAHTEPDRHRDIITDMALQEVVNLFSQYPSLNQMSKESAIQHATGTAAHLISEMASNILPGVTSPSSTAHTLREHSPTLSHHTSRRHRSFSRGRSRDPGLRGLDHHGRYHDPRDDYDIRQQPYPGQIPSVMNMGGSYPPPSHIPPPIPHNDPYYGRGHGHQSQYIPGAHYQHGGAHGSAYPPYHHPLDAPHMPMGMVGPDPYRDHRGRSRHREYDSYGRGRSHHRSHSMNYPAPSSYLPSQQYPYQQSPYYPPGQTQTVSYLNTGSGMVPLPPGADLYMPSHHDRHRSRSRHDPHRHRSRDHSRGRSKLRSKSRRKPSRSRSKHHHSKHHRSGSHHQPAYRSTSYDPHYSSSHRYY